MSGNAFDAEDPGAPEASAKAGATIAAENGARAWRTLAQAEPYTEAAQQQVLAGRAMGLIAVGIFVKKQLGGLVLDAGKPAMEIIGTERR